MDMSRLFAAILLFFCTSVLSAQVQMGASLKSGSADTVRGKRTYLYMLHADATRGDEARLSDAVILVGDVQLRRDSMYMYCDSAYLFTKRNSVQAFGNVRMEQGDTLFLYGDYADYDGDLNVARVRGNVRLVDKNTVLETDSLNYDRNINLAYYFDGGTLSDEQSTLDSYWGEYDVNTKEAVFTDEVTLNNPQFVMHSDTLRYNTATNIAKIVGPTRIDNAQNRIVTHLGYYNTDKRQATLLKRSVVSNGSKEITGDSLFYDELTGVSVAFGNIVYTDTVGRNMLTGEYGYMNELVDSSYVTDRAVVMDYSQGDTLYMSADTIWAVTRNAETDSLYRMVRACHKVRAFRSDIQAVCDSLVFDSRDTCMTMYKDPILWYNNMQLLGEEIRIYMDTASIDWVNVINQTLYAERMADAEYNQIRGQEMRFFFDNGKLGEMQVVGSVEVRYYPVDGDGLMMGLNCTESGKLTAYMKDGEVDKILIPTKADGIFYPLTQIPQEKRYLSNFAWFDYVRPMNKDDIFRWRSKSKEQQLKKVERGSVPLPTFENFAKEKNN
ncbi:MAG: hypothetical protein IKV23_02760 [Bacteroidaceae bacterium]|nr:hypothetical protein [Bacteroidaceae bacterium]